MAKAGTPKKKAGGLKKKSKAVTINRELETIKHAIKKSDDESSERAKDAERLRNNFAELQKQYSDQRQAEDRYNADYENIHKEYKEALKYYDTNEPMIQAAIKQKKIDTAPIDRLISDFDNSIEELDKDRARASKQSENTGRKYNRVLQQYDESLKKWSQLLNRPQTLAAELKEWTLIREQYEKELNVKKKHFWFRELGRLLARCKVKLKSSASFAAELESVRRVLRSKNDLRIKSEQIFAKANAKVKSIETQREEREKNRPAEILDKL